MLDWVKNTLLVMILCETFQNGTLSLTGSKCTHKVRAFYGQLGIVNLANSFILEASLSAPTSLKSI